MFNPEHLHLTVPPDCWDMFAQPRAKVFVQGDTDVALLGEVVDVEQSDAPHGPVWVSIERKG